MHVTAKFHHPTFNHSEVTVLINKQTDKQTLLKTSTSLHYATPVGKNALWTWLWNKVSDTFANL